MAYQFVHVNTYSIKSGGAGIAAEAGRKPAHSRHVENPQPPVLLAGVEPELAWGQIEQRHEKARDLVTLKNGRKAERRLRSDASVLLAAVASYPEPTETCDTDSPDFQDWQKRTLDWFTAQHGEPLSAVLHLDETHPHIHFLTAPNLEDGQRMRDIHPGERAKAVVGGKSAGRIEKRQAFSEAMRQYQDGYHQAVGVHHGQARLGPKRQRLTRDEWKTQQAELKRQAERLKGLETDRVAVKAAEDAVFRAKTKVNSSKDRLSQFRQELVDSKSQLDSRIVDVSARERRLGGLWGQLVSAATFGRMGTERRVNDAVSATRSEFQAKLDTKQDSADKALREHQRAVERLNSENRLLTEQNITLTGAVTAAERAQQQVQEKAQKLAEKIGPMETTNAELTAARDNLAELVNDLEAAINSGDLALAQDLLNPDSAGPELRV